MLVTDLFLDMPQQRAYRCWQRLIGGTPGHEDIAGTLQRGLQSAQAAMGSLGLKVPAGLRGFARGQRLQCVSASQAIYSHLPWRDYAIADPGSQMFVEEACE